MGDILNGVTNRPGASWTPKQFLSRGLRMPYAKRRAAESLNRAYAHVSEASFGAAASGLADKLVAMGFEEDEAKDAIEPAQGHFDDTGLFAQREKPKLCSSFPAS